MIVTPNRRCSYLQLRGTSSLILHTDSPVSLAFVQVVLRVVCVLKAVGFDRLQHSHLQLESPPRWNARGLPHDNQHSVDVVLYEWMHTFFWSLGAFPCVVIGMLSAWQHTWTVKHQIRTVLADQMIHG